jgi:predicted DNA binding CopG/RHH family protein
MTMIKKPSTKPYSDREERDLIEAMESADAEFKSVLTPARRKKLKTAARATMNGEREKITLRISRADLSRLKSRALQEGLPYQTLINSILHKAVS